MSKPKPKTTTQLLKNYEEFMCRSSMKPRPERLSHFRTWIPRLLGETSTDNVTVDQLLSRRPEIWAMLASDEFAKSAMLKNGYSAEDIAAMSPDQRRKKLSTSQKSHRRNVQAAIKAIVLFLVRDRGACSGKKIITVDPKEEVLGWKHCSLPDAVARLLKPRGGSTIYMWIRRDHLRREISLADATTETILEALKDRLEYHRLNTTAMSHAVVINQEIQSLYNLREMPGYEFLKALPLPSEMPKFRMKSTRQRRSLSIDEAESMWSDELAEIKRFYMDPEHRRKVCGSLERWRKLAKVGISCTKSWKDRHSAIRRYAWFLREHLEMDISALTLSDIFNGDMLTKYAHWLGKQYRREV